MNLGTTIVFGLFHTGAIAALFMFSWKVFFATVFLYWVATHRVHHQKSDQAGDPHSPRDGAWWSHVL
jgi:fatty-acid desaturase